MKRVVLSSPLILEAGEFESRYISLEDAMNWIEAGSLENYCNHETIKILGLVPPKSRESATYYDEALCIKTKERLEFGREYTVEEIEEIGYNIILIKKKGMDK